MTREVPADNEDSHSVTPWVRWAGPAIATAALVTYVVVYTLWPTLRLQIDVQVYRMAGERLLAGFDLYSTGLTGNPDELLFLYPPFAAICAIPLALLDAPSVQVLWLLGAVAAVTYIVVRMLKSMGLNLYGGLLSLAALLAGVIAWLEPVRLTAELGQINLVLLALVTADLLAAKQSKWAGMGIGLAAGIKLTPGLFIVYLLVTGRIRAALVAAATFACTVGLGFALAPSSSQTYWLHGLFHDVNRISHDPVANTSLSGLWVRLGGSPGLATVAAVVLAVIALAIAVMAYRRGQAVLALAIVGLASAAVSPFSWSHHWVWFAPLVVHLGYRGNVVGSRLATTGMWLLCALIGGWFVSTTGDSPQAGILSLRPGGGWDEILAGTYVLTFVSVLAATAVWLRRLPLTGLGSHGLHDVERAHAQRDHEVVLAQ